VSTKQSLPSNLLEAVRYFADLDVANDFVAKMRWPDGPMCPACGSTEYSYLTTRRVYKCKQKECRKQYTVKLGTIFSDSPLGLDKWLPAVWLVANSKNGISSHELGRALGVTQKSAWFMVHRIRLAMQTGSFDKLDGEVEADEAFIGGKAINMHPAKRAEKITATGGKDKTIVFGLRQRGGEVRVKVIPNHKKETLHAEVRENVDPRRTPLYRHAQELPRPRPRVRPWDHRPRREVRRGARPHERPGELLESAQARPERHLRPRRS
jgi:transposase-like protein